MRLFFFLLLASGLQGETRVLSNHVPAAVARARRLGPMTRSARLNLAIGLSLRNQDELDRLLRETDRKYLTSEQFVDRFGPLESDYQAVIGFAESQGLKVAATHPNRMIVDVTGTVEQIESAFQIGLVAWRDDARGSFYAPDRAPSVDASLPILDVAGLDNYLAPRPMSLHIRPLSSYASTGSGPAGLLIGGDFRAAYAPGVNLTGTGQTIGLFELDGFYASDVAANFKAAGLPAVPVQTVLLDGSNGAPGDGSIEVTLDIMMASYMAPGASKIVVYEGYNPNDVLNRMASDNTASQLSCSWGFPINGTTEQIFREMIAQGQSFFQASGDSGAYVGGVMPPSDDPNVTVVGGTHLATAGPGGAWTAETAWSDSGGGVSTTYAIPGYQQGVSMAAVGGSTTMRNIPDVALTADVQMFLIQNNGQAVSVGGTSAAAPLWAGFLALVNQQGAAKGLSPVGFLNPAIYPIGEGSHFAADLHDIVIGNNGFSAEPGYDLVTGWGTPSGQTLIDQLTGTQSSPSFSIASSPAALSITPGTTVTSAITVTASNGFSGAVAMTVTGLPAGVTASFSSTSASGSGTLTLSASSSAVAGKSAITVSGKSGSIVSTFAIGLTVTAASGFTLSNSPASIALVQGTSAKTTITVSAVNGFSGTVVLSTSALPAGVTAVFARGTVAGTSILTLSASASAAMGTTTVTVIGNSGSLTETAAITLTVSGSPTFALTASPASLSLTQGASASSVVGVNGQNGFSGSVSLSVSGLPAGVTGSFNQSTLTLSAGSSAPPGTATITVTGTSGGLTRTLTMAVTVTGAPSYLLSVAPAALSVAQGSAASASIALTPQNGFNGKVTLSTSGLPAGVTAVFSAGAGTGTSTVTLSAASSAGLGSATVTITGASGTVTKTATIALTVLAGADFSLSAAQGSLSILAGMSGADILRITSLNGFNGTVTLAASGLPAGVTATFGTSGTVGVDLVTFAVGSSAAKGTSTVTITGSSGNLSHKTTLALTVAAASGGTTAVNLTSVFNVSGIAVDGVPFTGGGLDNGGRSYSGLLSGATQNIGGVAFGIAPMSGPAAVSGKTVSLPAGQYASLRMLATAVNGNQTGQTFTVNYTDGTKSVFTQSLSDWATPQNYPGESTAMTMPYRDNSTGTLDGRPFVLYGYSFSLTPGKTVSSVVLPTNRNVVALSLTLTSH